MTNRAADTDFDGLAVLVELIGNVFASAGPRQISVHKPLSPEVQSSATDTSKDETDSNDNQ